MTLTASVVAEENRANTMMRIGRIVMVAAALTAAGAGQSTAQGRPLSVAGSRDLTFGTLFPGVPQTIVRTDAANAGQFQVSGTRNLEVRAQLTLPSLMTAPGGATMALSFAPGDGGYNTQNNIGTAQAFDPGVPLVTRLPGTGRLFIWLGGTVLPSGTQAAGAYAALITLTVAYTGN